MNIKWNAGRKAAVNKEIDVLSTYLKDLENAAKPVKKILDQKRRSSKQ
jgi:hypothetical protein